MFNNLIESSSHRKEVQRRGSFFLFTTVSYALLFSIAGVVSIYAYDARLEDAGEELVIMMAPVDTSSTMKSKNDHSATATRKINNKRLYDERQNAIASLEHPELQPQGISIKPNEGLPVRDNFPTLLTGRDLNADGGPPGPGWDKSSDYTVRNAARIIPQIEIPPPLPEPTVKVVRKNVITSEAIFLPKPPYPPLAKIMHIQGMVSVQVLVDETGNVVSAKPIAGNPALIHEAVKAAYHARFSPTYIGDQPVKVSGVITYNFVLQ
jgi:periplasmic protein TonB